MLVSVGCPLRGRACQSECTRWRREKQKRRPIGMLIAGKPPAVRRFYGWGVGSQIRFHTQTKPRQSRLVRTCSSAMGVVRPSFRRATLKRNT